jgi:cyclopropane fatty-acyl-phospholipid synthase-like methyltransferase
MVRSRDEDELQERFRAHYATVGAPELREIERRVLGADYGGSSYADVAQADRIGALLGLVPGVRLLDVGAGSGWPGLYLARTTGCKVVLTDLPIEGLRAARARADLESISGCGVVRAAATDLPFRDATFDAVIHADVLC